MARPDVQLWRTKAGRGPRITEAEMRKAWQAMIPRDQRAPRGIVNRYAEVRKVATCADCGGACQNSQARLCPGCAYKRNADCGKRKPPAVKRGGRAKYDRGG